MGATDVRSDQLEHRLKLRELRILLTVAKAGSMAKAAAELAISQPNVSKAIADLEQAFGARLLDRGVRGVEPTPYGVAISRRGGRVGIEHDCGPLEPRRDLRKQLKPLASQRGFHAGEACDVPTRAVEPRDDAADDGVAHVHKDDRELRRHGRSTSISGPAEPAVGLPGRPTADSLR